MITQLPVLWRRIDPEIDTLPHKERTPELEANKPAGTRGDVTNPMLTHFSIKESGPLYSLLINFPVLRRRLEPEINALPTKRERLPELEDNTLRNNTAPSRARD